MWKYKSNTILKRFISNSSRRDTNCTFSGFPPPVQLLYCCFRCILLIYPPQPPPPPPSTFRFGILLNLIFGWHGWAWLGSLFSALWVHLLFSANVEEAKRRIYEIKWKPHGIRNDLFYCNHFFFIVVVRRSKTLFRCFR